MSWQQEELLVEDVAWCQNRKPQIVQVDMSLGSFGNKISGELTDNLNIPLVYKDMATIGHRMRHKEDGVERRVP